MIAGLSWPPRAPAEVNLSENHRLLLQAALGEGAPAAAAYKAWRSRVPLDDIDPGAYRILGHVVHTANLNRIEDPEMPRIKGVLKHTWISNMLRMRALNEAMLALQRAGIESLVLKGAALFARYPELATRLAVGDFDILVRQSDAPRAVTAMINAGFRATALRLDLFVAADFEKQHALALEHTALGGSIDLHWWPLPLWTSQEFVDELFERSEFGKLEGHGVRIPDLADHLFLTLARPDPWDGDEIFARTIETVQILRGCNGNVDWQRVVALLRRFHCGAIAGGVLALVRSELGVAVPSRVPIELQRSGSLLNRSDVAIRHKRVTERSPLERLALRTISLVRSHPKVSRSLVRTGSTLLLCPQFRGSLHRAALEELPQFPGRSAESAWKAYANRKAQFAGSHVDYVMGFSRPEDGGRWTEAYAALMTLPVAADVGTRVQVCLTVVPLLAANKRRFAFEICGGEGLVTGKVLTMADRLPARIMVEAEIIGAPGFRGVVLAFNLPDAARPSELGASDDTRALGLFVQGVEVSAGALLQAERQGLEDVGAISGTAMPGRAQWK